MKIFDDDSIFSDDTLKIEMEIWEKLIEPLSKELERVAERISADQHQRPWPESEKFEHFNKKPPNPITHPEDALWYAEYKQAMLETTEQRYARLQEIVKKFEAYARRDEERYRYARRWEQSVSGTNRWKNKLETVTHKSLFIAAMKKFIKDEQTLDNFLANAKEGRVQGLRLKPNETQYESERLQRYILSADDAPKRKKKITYKTLQTWWTEAKKESAPK